MKNKKLLIVLGIIALLAVGLIAIVIKKQTVNSNAFKLRIGVLLPLSGEVAADGEEAMRGIKIARDRYNLQHENKMELYFGDTKFDPKTAVSELNRLFALNTLDALIVLGGVPAMAIHDIARTHGIPQVGIAVADKSFAASPEACRMWFNSVTMAQTMADYSYHQLGARSASIMAINNTFGMEAQAAFAEHFRTMNGQILGMENYEIYSSDEKAQVIKLIQNSPEVVFVTGFGQGYITAINQLRQLGYQGHIVTDNAILDPRVHKNITSLTDIFFIGTKFEERLPTNENARFFFREFSLDGKQGPSMLAIFAYDAVNILGSEDNLIDLKKKYTQDTPYQSLVGELYYDSTGELALPLVVKTFSASREVINAPM